MTPSFVGAPLARREDARVLRGETRYLDDIRRPGQAHVAFVRSPHAHARIIEISVPSRADGLIATFTAADLADLRPFPVTRPAGTEVSDSEAHPVLASDEVRYAGQPVVAVVAGSRAMAEDIAELVEIEYEELAPTLSARASDVELMRWSTTTGDVPAAFAAAEHVAHGSYELPRLAPAPMETRGVVAQPGADGRLRVWCSAQDIHRPLAQLSHILARDPDSIHLIVPDVGGAFGSKGVIAPEVAVVAAAATRLGMPVGWTEDRLENLVGSYQGRGIEGDLELALDTDGRMLGLRARMWADLGGYLLTTTAIPPHTAATLIPGCYDIPATDVCITGMQTHRVPTGPYRGAGRPDAAYMIEALVDEAARRTGIDRVALRRRNLIRRFPHRTATGLEYDSGDFDRCLDLALELSEAPAPAPASGAVTGSGIALYVERAGGGFETAEAQLTEGGGFVIHSSSSPHGQGHDITFAQIAADRLTVEPGQVELRFGDSATSPPGVGTFGSRSVAQAGSAVALAADALADEGRRLAAHLLGADGADVRLQAGGFAASADGDRVSWAQLAAAARDPERNPEGRQPGPLRARERFASANVFSSGAHAAQVAIDAGTGELTVLRLVAVDDSGTMINPLLVHGQVLGGVVQALGECLTEEAVYDEAGQPRSGSLLDYNLLTTAEIPPIITGEVQTPSPLNPLGAKGAGEGGAVGALPAIANAVRDALGGRPIDPPFTAEKLWSALQEAADSAWDAPPAVALSGSGSPARQAPPSARSPGVNPGGPRRRDRGREQIMVLSAGAALAACAALIALARRGRSR
jgi:carbon-monoxide dehydrogenase large subunit